MKKEIDKLLELFDEEIKNANLNDRLQTRIYITKEAKGNKDASTAIMIIDKLADFKNVVYNTSVLEIKLNLKKDSNYLQKIINSIRLKLE